MALIIEDGNLIGYEEEAGESLITIPEGVVEIAKGVFADSETLWEVVLPESLRKIGANAFLYCQSLRRISIPPLIEAIEYSTFCQCFQLSEVHLPVSITRIGERAFYSCAELKEFPLPPGLTEIGAEAFGLCRRFKRITIPETVSTIGNNAFANNPSLAEVTLSGIPQQVGKQVFHEKTRVSFPIDVFMSGSKIPDSAAAYLNKLNAKEIALLVIHQPNKAWKELVLRHLPGMVNPEQTLSAMLSKLEAIKGMRQPQLTRIAEFVQNYARFFNQNTLTKILEYLQNQRYAGIDNMKAHADIQRALDDAPAHPMEQYALQRIRALKNPLNIHSIAYEEIPYADSDQVCSRETLAYLLHCYPYKSYVSAMKINNAADRIANALDRERFCEYLEKQVKTKSYQDYLGAYARYGTAEHIIRLIKESAPRNHPSMRQKARSGDIWEALFLSNERAAVLAVEANGQLDDYAELHKLSLDTIRDNILYNFGLDRRGEKHYDLGNKTIVARLNNSLQIDLYDTATSKQVKSIPKRGADPVKYEMATADYLDIKQHLKKAVKTRTDSLFKDFLEGKTYGVEAWTASHLGENPLLGQIASMLVWEQGNRSFTVKGHDVIDSNTRVLKLDDQMPVALAHPMEMSEQSLSAWQRYFASNNLKQPFAQIWEPVVDISRADSKRYMGNPIPLYRFSGQEKHGIYLRMDRSWGGQVDSIEIDIDDFPIEYQFHWGPDLINIMELPVEITTVHSFMKSEDLRFGSPYERFPKRMKRLFAAKPRRINHYLAYLDKFVAMSMVKNNDIKVQALLPSFTLAQVLELIKISVTNQNTAMTAMLLEHKNNRWSDLGSFHLDELTLD